MVKLARIILSALLLISTPPIITSKVVVHDAQLNDETKTNIVSIWPNGQRAMGNFYSDSKPSENDVLSFLNKTVTGTSNWDVINDITVGTPSATTGSITRAITAKPKSRKYDGTFNVTYTVSDRNIIDLSTYGNPLSISFVSSQPTNKDVLQAFVNANSLSISINQLDIDTGATKTIVSSVAFSYLIIPSSYSNVATGSVRIVAYKTGQSVPISALIPNTYISIFNTPTTNINDIKSKVKYWNDYYINDEIANALTLTGVGYDRTYEGHGTASLSTTYSFITGSIGLTWMYVPDNSRIDRPSGSTATTNWTLTSSAGTTVSITDGAAQFDCFINNFNLTNFRAVNVKPIIRVCDLTHTVVREGNIGYNSGHPDQADDGYHTCLYPPQDTDPAYLFHNHMNASMRKVYLMSTQSGASRIAVFGDPNLTEIWCKKPAGTVNCSCYSGNSRPPCNPSYVVHLPRGSSCTFSGIVTENYGNDDGTGNNSSKRFMNEYPTIFPQYSSNNAYYNNKVIDFQYVYDF